MYKNYAYYSYNNSSLYYDRIPNHSRICFSVFHAHYSENVKGRNQLVMENLRDQEYKVIKLKIPYHESV